ncbi:hypothetical protein HDU98_004441 [Podochytrium sp. JEL0797]|nr:hypothetical protein HDU98_004441 [Podochytrium sp. JEL0797]
MIPFESLLPHFPADEDLAPTDTNFPRWTETDDTFAPFIPTSLTRVCTALRLAACGPTDVVLDLGCGDGRFCVTAVGMFGASAAVGVESDDGVVRLAEEKRDVVLEGVGMREKVVYVCEDFRECEEARREDVSIVVVFLSPEFGVECRDLLLAHYERGARIVALVFDLSDLKELEVKEGCRDVDGIWVYEKPKI